MTSKNIDLMDFARLITEKPLEPFQEEIIQTLAIVDYAEIEKRIMHMTRGHSKQALQDSMLYGTGIDYVCYDSYTNIPLDDWYKNYSLVKKIKIEKDWKRTRFVSGEKTTPSSKKRAQLRAKRKKR